MVREGRSLGEAKFEEVSVGKGSSKMLFVCGPWGLQILGGRGRREWEPGVGTAAAWGRGEGARGGGGGGLHEAQPQSQVQLPAQGSAVCADIQACRWRSGPIGKSACMLHIHFLPPVTQGCLRWRKPRA